MKKLYIFFSVTAILFIIIFNCQQTGGSGGGGGGGGDDDTPSKWASQVKIIAVDAQDDARFGISVSIAGDYAIVGVPNEDVDGVNRGAVYFYHRTGTNTWDSVFKLTASDGANGDNFGTSVSISGDYAIVGAPWEDGGEIDRGAAYIYHRIGENIWGEEKKIIASDAAADDRFGQSVSISGNYALVGANREDGSGTDRGAAYIYRRVALDIWDENAKITASDAADDDWFGISVSISGEYAIVGARGQAGNTGTAYIFHMTGLLDTWIMEAKLVASDAAAGTFFGNSVSISGGYAVVGALAADVKGAAYIFYRTGAGIWDTGTKIASPFSAEFDYFGCSVSISGDYVIVGAYSEDIGGIDTDRGAAYIFQRIGENRWNTGTRITAFDAADEDYFGYSASISGNYAIVGAYREDGSGANRGAVYMFK